MIKNSLFVYGNLAKLFHWAMAILFIMMFTVAYIMINIPKSTFRFSLYDFHKATGILLLSIAFLRLLWRFVNLRPILSSKMNKWQRRLAKLNIIVLYGMMFAMPISGFLTSTLGGHIVSFYGFFSITPLMHSSFASGIFSYAHELLSYGLITSFTLHVLAALYHQFFLKDQVLKRMWVNSHFSKKGYNETAKTYQLDQSV